MRRTVLTAFVIAATASVGSLSGAAATASRHGRHRRAGTCTTVDCLRINQIQVIGTHNSYHLQADPDVFGILKAFDPALAASLEYSHPPLAQQFGGERIRQIELDAFADPNGGLYADRHIYTVLGKPIASGIADLSRPGLKVMHVQDVDFKTQCYTFVACLKQVRRWSQRHPSHVPITILVEAKDDPIIDPVNLGFVIPLPFDAAALDEVDSEVRSVFPPSELITPDDIRGGYPTLEEAVLAGNAWPTIGASRGKVLFLLDNASRRDLYLQGHPSLAGRVMFTNSSPGQPDAAFVEMNDPVGSDGLAWQQIQANVAAGYVVRTRADADTIQARSGDTTMRDDALRSGAQWISTDYPNLSDNPFGTSYFVELPGGGVARCNPVNAGRACKIIDG